MNLINVEKSEFDEVEKSTGAYQFLNVSGFKDVPIKPTLIKISYSKEMKLAHDNIKLLCSQQETNG